VLLSKAKQHLSAWTPNPLQGLEAEGIEEKIGNTRVINVGKSGKIIDI